MRYLFALASPLIAATMLSGCVPQGEKPPPTAMAVIEPVDTGSVNGRITFGDDNGVTRLFVDLTGLTGEHGFHIYEEGDCRAALANLSNGHFNPEHKPHGQHMGDLPNIKSDNYGTMRGEMYVRTITLTGKDSVVGHALIVTSRYDDYKTQPDGRSGQAIACGVIRNI